MTDERSTTNHARCWRNPINKTHKMSVVSGEMIPSCIWCGQDWNPEWDE